MNGTFFIAILRGYCHKNGKTGLLLLLRRILRLAVVFFQQQNQIPHDKDNAAPKHDDAKKQNFDARGVGHADQIRQEDLRQHKREKQQSGAVENDAVSDLRFVLFAHRVASFAFVQGYGIFKQMSISAEIMIDNTGPWLLLWCVETRCTYGTVTETN